MSAERLSARSNRQYRFSYWDWARFPPLRQIAVLLPGVFDCDPRDRLPRRESGVKTLFDLARFRGHRLKQGCLYAGRTAQPPQNARQSKHQLALNGRFSVIVGNYCSFEGLVILCILERRNDGLGGKAVAQGIAARTLFALWRRWPGAFERVAAVGLDLLERAH